MLALQGIRHYSIKVFLTGKALIKEVCRRILVARSYWDAHNKFDF